MFKRLSAALLLAAPALPVWAYGPTVGLDAFYSHQDSSDATGEGFGARITAKLSADPDFFLASQYQQNDVDAGTLKQWRAGFGMGAWTDDSAFIYWQLEYVDLNLPGIIDDQGGAAHLGLAASITPRLSLYARGGYLQLKDNDGPEFVTGLAGQISGGLGAFAEYRYTRLDSIELNDIWAGLRFTF